MKPPNIRLSQRRYPPPQFGLSRDHLHCCRRNAALKFEDASGVYVPIVGFRLVIQPASRFAKVRCQVVGQVQFPHVGNHRNRAVQRGAAAEINCSVVSRRAARQLLDQEP
jgi:hypothetical protein